MSSARPLGLWAAMVLVAGNMIGSGLFLLPASMGAVGSISLISWAIASGGAMALALVFASLGLMEPEADGAVAYVSRGLHPALGHLGWFAYWLNCWVGTAGVALAVTGYLTFFLPGLKGQVPSLITTLCAIWLFVGANLLGPRLVARIGGATLILGLLPIVIATGIGIWAFDADIFAASWNVSGKPAGQVITTAIVPAFWAFLGLESANICAAVIDNPRRNLPLAAVGGVAIAAGVYMTTSAVLMGLMSAHDLAASSAPFADALRRSAGGLAAGLVAFCALAKSAGTLGGWILVTAETQRSGAVAGFLPRFLSSQGLPVRDLIFAGFLMSIATIGTVSPTLGGQFTILINVSVILAMILYLLCSLALLRRSGEIEGTGAQSRARLAALAGGGFSLWVIVTMDPGLRLPTLVTGVASLGLWLLSRRRSVP